MQLVILLFPLLLVCASNCSVIPSNEEADNYEIIADKVEKMMADKRQHWSKGLSPGGKRSYYDDNVVKSSVSMDDFSATWFLNAMLTYLQYKEKYEQLRENGRDFHLIPNIFSANFKDDEREIPKRQHWSTGLSPGGKRSSSDLYAKQLKYLSSLMPCDGCDHVILPEN